MLREIRCAHFRHKLISFHSGLNVILGDDDAKNSIGKSTMLMAIDFVLGGTTFLKDDAGVIRFYGHHRYDFAFEIGAERRYFSRATDSDNVVQVCNEVYEPQSDLALSEFTHLLRRLYGMEVIENSFRSAINPFGRTWKKGGLDPSHPFAAVPKEVGSAAVGRLIDFFCRSADVSSERKTLTELKDLKKVINESVTANIIPKVTKALYKANKLSIIRNTDQIEQLRSGFGGALNVYESLFEGSLRLMQQHKNELAGQRTELQNKIGRLEREISGITPRLAANIALLADFFPTVDVQRLAQVEAFHHKIGSIVKKELKDELAESLSRETALASEMAAVEREILRALEAKGMPDDVFSRVLELKDELDKAISENEHFDRNANVEESMSLASERLNSIYSGIFLGIEKEVNQKLKAFNNVVYGPSRTSSELRIKSANSYLFTSPEDTGIRLWTRWLHR